VSARRQVRVAPSFFDRLDELLPEERSAVGVPSTADFLLHEMPTLIDVLALDYEGVTLAVSGVPEVRVLIATGVLVARLALYVVLGDDDAVEIIYLEIDAVGQVLRPGGHAPWCPLASTGPKPRADVDRKVERTVASEHVPVEVEAVVHSIDATLGLVEEEGRRADLGRAEGARAGRRGPSRRTSQVASDLPSLAGVSRRAP
jgi:hypothetical protein